MINNISLKKIISRFERNLKLLSEEQKKIIYIGLGGLAVLLLFWIFIYLPQNKKMNALKAGLADIETQISDITSVAAGKDLAQVMKELKTSSTKIINKLPTQDEVVIYNLSDAADKLHIEVKSITPSAAKALEGAIPDYEVMELPITMNLLCEFKALGQYLTMLRSGDFPVLVQVRQINIKGNGEGQLYLDINLQLCAYLAKKR